LKDERSIASEYQKVEDGFGNLRRLPATKGGWDNALSVEFLKYPADTMIADASSGTNFALRESFSGELDDQDFGRG
jgi:hypothetical protein